MPDGLVSQLKPTQASAPKGSDVIPVFAKRKRRLKSLFWTPNNVKGPLWKCKKCSDQDWVKELDFGKHVGENQTKTFRNDDQIFSL